MGKMRGVRIAENPLLADTDAALVEVLTGLDFGMIRMKRECYRE